MTTNRERAIKLILEHSDGAIERALDKAEKRGAVKISSIGFPTYKDGFVEGQKDMQERAANEALTIGYKTMHILLQDYGEEIAEAIRALKIEGE